MLSVDFLAPEDERRVIKFSGGHTIPFTMGSASSVWPPGVFEYLGKVGRYLGRIFFFFFFFTFLLGGRPHSSAVWQISTFVLQALQYLSTYGSVVIVFEALCNAKVPTDASPSPLVDRLGPARSLLDDRKLA